MSPDSNGVLRELVEGPPADSLAAARERFAGLAEEAGLIDVAYSTEDSPFGPILLAATDLGLVMVSLPGYEPDSALERLASQVSPRVVEAPARLDEARRELDLYFSGDCGSSTCPWTGS